MFDQKYNQLNIQTWQPIKDFMQNNIQSVQKKNTHQSRLPQGSFEGNLFERINPAIMRIDGSRNAFAQITTNQKKSTLRNKI